jgi:hypothetical protein
MPFFNNSPMAAGIAMAMAIVVSRALKSQPESPQGPTLQ